METLQQSPLQAGEGSGGIVRAGLWQEEEFAKQKMRDGRMWVMVLRGVTALGQ